MSAFFELHFSPEVKALIYFLISLGRLVLPLGYAAGIVTLCQRDRFRAAMAGFRAAGQMALTNYVMQSLVYNLAFYGIGLGLLRYAGPTTCLITAIFVFAAQMAFSSWWLARYRFGPLEWLWRSGTYGKWQSMRLHSSSATGQSEDLREAA